jgi:hypothetical protein
VERWLGDAAFDAAQFTPGTPETVTRPTPLHTWFGSGYGPHWMEGQHSAGGEHWRWTLQNPAAGTHERTASYDFTTADRRFRRELVALTLADLADPAKMPVELRGVKEAIRAASRDRSGSA